MEIREFRAFILDPAGHVQYRIDLLCASEAEAKERAKALVDGHDVELWEGAHKIALFRHGETGHP